MVTGGGSARIELVLGPTDATSFAAEAARPDLPEWAAPDAADLIPPLPEGTGPIAVVLDPGHGGIDPGAERDGQTEAALMLTFARELKEVLVRDGRFRVVMTRDDDVFVPLETRTSIAREAEADLFISLHADALAEGDAQGATVYTLTADATDEAAAALAERHDRDDLLAGVDLSEQDDVVAEVLMDMARTETAPRTERLAGAVVAAIKAADIRMHRRPQQTGGFSVLKSPDIPSVLLELGFLSSDRDFRRLSDAKWRAMLAEARSCRHWLPGRKRMPPFAPLHRPEPCGTSPALVILLSKLLTRGCVWYTAGANSSGVTGASVYRQYFGRDILVRDTWGNVRRADARRHFLHVFPRPAKP